MNPLSIQNMTLIEEHVNAISKHVCGTSFINKSIESAMLDFLYQLSKHRCMGNVMKFLSPFLKGFLRYILSWISFCLSLGRIYP